MTRVVQPAIRIQEDVCKRDGHCVRLRPVRGDARMRQVMDLTAEYLRKLHKAVTSDGIRVAALHSLPPRDVRIKWIGAW